jgi:hypothetical protein
MCSNSSFFASQDGVQPNSSAVIQTLCIIPSSIVQNSRIPGPGPAKDYLDRDVRFYQLFVLNTLLGLSVAICCATPSKSSTLTGAWSSDHAVTAPTTKITRPGKNVLSSARIIGEENFIDDGLDAELNNPSSVPSLSVDKSTIEAKNDTSLYLNAQSLFEAAFEEHSGPGLALSPTNEQFVSDYVEHIIKALEIRKSLGMQGYTNL